mmetsp:Transcript_7856/g.15078  ORF Transcript_7856/g.15078 Transcript_7856/m.15078 type:complete len:90 (+) Transcript_7856:50-319(+)
MGTATNYNNKQQVGKTPQELHSSARLLSFCMKKQNMWKKSTRRQCGWPQRPHKGNELPHCWQDPPTHSMQDKVSAGNRVMAINHLLCCM